MLFHIFFSMFVTFIVFPGVTSAKTVNLSFIGGRAWFDLFMVTLFNLFDTTGRLIGGIPKFMFSKDSHWISVVSFSRLLLVGLSIMIMLEVFQHDTTIIVNTVLLGFSNGYVQTICCCYAPAKVDSDEQ